jgi:delta1-piperideine-2-carboxylate reductase
MAEAGRSTQTKVSIARLTELVRAVFLRRGMSERDAAIMAGVVVAAERDGTRSHGIQRMRGYVDSIECGWIDPKAEPLVRQSATSLLKVDAANGFAQIALAHVASKLMELARRHGIAMASIHNSHHFAALWPDIEPFADAGFITLTMVNSRPWITAWDNTKRVLGTNPMAFACPRAVGGPVIWDQASSRMSQGDVLLHARSGRPLPEGVGVDAAGHACTDAAAVLEGGALLPFGGAKGSSIAFMVEVLVAAFGGGKFGFEDDRSAFPKATTSNTGQFVLLLDQKVNGGGFSDRIEALLAEMAAQGVKRFPADRRYAARKAAEQAGVSVPSDLLAELERYAVG